MSPKVKAAGIVSGEPKVAQLSRVFAALLKRHAEALNEVTAALTPFLETHITVDGNKVSAGEELVPATVPAVLLRLPFAAHPAINPPDLVQLKKSAKVSAKQATALKKAVESALEAYRSSQDAAEAIENIMRPLDQAADKIARLRGKGVKAFGKVDKLAAYEKFAHKFVDELKSHSLDDFAEEDPAHFLERIEGYGLEVHSTSPEYNTWPNVQSLSEHPWVARVEDFSDIERYHVPYFMFIDTLDEAYAECREQFEKCSGKTGFLARPGKKLEEETETALASLNTRLCGVVAAGRLLGKVGCKAGADDAARVLDGLKKDPTKELKHVRSLMERMNGTWPLFIRATYGANAVR